MTGGTKHSGSSTAPSMWVFVACVAGLYGSFIPYGIVQEWVYKHRASDGSRFTYTTTLLLAQTIGNCIVSLTFILVLRQGWKTFPLRQCWLPGGSFIAAMGFSNEALIHVSFPTQALAKSSKMVPVLLGGVILFGKRYSFLEYLQVAMVTFGIFLFQYKNAENESGSSTLYGMVLLMLSLLMDGITGPTQDDITARTRCTSFQLGLACNMWAVLYLAINVFAFQEGTAGFEYMLAHREVLHYALLSALLGAIGQVFIFYTMTTFGALKLTFATTTRKFFTILASIFFFDHFLHTQQWIGIALVFAGLGIEALHKSAGKKHKSS